MLSSFRALLVRPGARPLVVVCLLGWFSAIGTGLALILLVHHLTRSFSLAGVAVAIYAIAVALPAPLRGRLVDRQGSRGLLALAGGQIVGAGLLAWAYLTHDDAALLMSVAISGSCVLPLIGVARGRWTIIAGAELTSAAHALNAAISDAAEFAAPALVAGISLALSPVVAYLAIVLASVSGAGVLARAGLPRNRQADGGARPGSVIRGNPGLQMIATSDVMLGAWSAAMELVVVALAAQHGHAPLAGLTLAAGAAGSVAVSLTSGSGRLTAPPSTRYLVGALLSVVGLLALLFATDLVVVGAVLVIVGAGVGLQNIAVYELLDLVSPPGRSTEAFAWLTTASAGGAAVGAVIAGHLADRSTFALRLIILGLAIIAAFIITNQQHRLRNPVDTSPGP
jgi:MFS family permease